MPAPIPTPTRLRILALNQRGHGPTAIAHRLGLCPRTVRHLCRRARQGGAAALAPTYPRPARPDPEPVVQQALLLHQEHPSWGAPYLLIRLRQLRPDLTELPGARTLQRWMRRVRQPPAPPGSKPASTRTAAQRPHEVWQMDAVEQLRLGNGSRVSWLRWVDEYTGAVLGTVVFPPRHLRSGARRRRAGGPAGAVPPLGSAAVPAGR